MITAHPVQQWARRVYALGLVLGVVAWAIVTCLVLASPMLLVLAVRR